MATVTLSLLESQVVDLAKRLSPEGKRALLWTLIPEMDSFEALVDYGTNRIRALCLERGIAWEQLSEEERERLIDELLHEAGNA